MTMHSLGSVRRRRLLLTAVAAGVGTAAGPLSWAGQPSLSDSVWYGRALGAPASMRLVHPDRDRARHTLSRCVNEINRLESLFSIYQPNSALSQLNRAGRLDHPPFELLELLSFSLALSRASKGAFDPTVQPLYALLAGHFSQAGAHPSGPPVHKIKQVMRSIDYRQVEISTEAVRLHGRGMALTLNGVAQGYITDRVAALLQEAGFNNLLIDIGEIIGRGRRADGRVWKAGIAHPQRSDQILFHVPLGHQSGLRPALATSSGLGTRFASNTAYHHLLDPHTGQSAEHHATVSVAADRAMIADGLSTALSIMPPASAENLLKHWPQAKAWLTSHDGQTRRVPAST